MYVLTLTLAFMLLLLMFRKKSFYEKSFISLIKSVETNENSIEIIFDSSYKIQNANQIAKQIIFKTTFFGNLALFDHNSFTGIDAINNKLSFSIILPSVQNYTGSLLFFNKEIELNSRNYKKRKLEATKEYKIELLSDWIDETNYSQLNCYGRTYSDRWCEMRNVAYFRGKLVFSSKGFFEFPSPFLVPGTRSPPYDRPDDRFVFEPILTHEELDAEKQNLTLYKDISYIMGRFYNSMMLWHILFDFAIPAYNTIMEVEGTMDNDERNVFMRDYEYDVYMDFVRIFSKKPVRNIMDTEGNMLFKRVIVGLKNFESNPSPWRREEDMTSFEYELNKTNGEGFRDFIIKQMNINKEEIDPKNPKILIIDREGSKRDIVNTEEIIDHITEVCNYCKVRKINFRMHSLKKQIELVSGASALIGLHGSGLSHVLWLQSQRQNPTALVEIKPYMYWCRDWYRVAADVADVEYISVMNKHKPETKGNFTKAFWCYSFKSHCPTLFCHDYIRDVDVDVEISEFEKQWKHFQEKLDKAYNNE